MEKIKVSLIKNGKEYKLYNESDFIHPNTAKAKKHNKPEEGTFIKVRVTGGNVKTTTVRDVVNPEVIKDIEQKMKDHVGTNPMMDLNKPEEKVVVETQTVQSPDIHNEDDEGFTEVNKKHINPDKNSELNLDNKSEKDFVEEAKKEQEELDKKEIESKISSKVNAKERVLINKFMIVQMKKFQFQDYDKSNQQQRSDMIDYLVASVSTKYNLEPEIAVMVVTEFVDSQYKFNDEKINDDKAKAEALAKEYYGDDYDEEESIQSMRRTSSSKEF
jgi:hypothetical protein